MRPFAVALAATAAFARTLTLEERVAAHRAVEAVEEALGGACSTP